MRLRLFPWKYILRRAASSQGFLDPITFLARLRSFAQPSEIKEPMELVRAGMVFQARGALNSRVIQFNLDWIWPYWAERQFNPNCPSFLPRGYALTHVNLTHRNWTAVGLPGLPLYPIVDPRGLVTPHFDGWSLDFMARDADGNRLFPSKAETAEQSLIMDSGLKVRTRVRQNHLQLDSTVETLMENDNPVLQISARAHCGPGGSLVASVRPYNPEGIQFVEQISALGETSGWQVDDSDLFFSRQPDQTIMSNYEKGDVLSRISSPDRSRIACPVGMSTAAAVFGAGKKESASIRVSLPLKKDLGASSEKSRPVPVTWNSALENTARLKLADERMMFLFNSAQRTLTLLSGTEIYPGPFTYWRFWFRDAVLMGNALLALNMTEQVGRHIQNFPDRQKKDGYFESQEGEWDSNGQVLWLADRWSRVAGKSLPEKTLNALMRGADWIHAKRHQHKSDNALCRGLFPAGFSAEHLGPNDHYYWDNFWGIAGLNAASSLAERADRQKLSTRYASQAADFRRDVFRSIEALSGGERQECIPAAPTRRMDAGAVGSLVADYPLQLTPPGDPRIMNTLDYLMTHCFYNGGFFQDMIHSGINVYLTLAMAQTLLRADDVSFSALSDTCAALATDTGNWPEAIHPFSGGGCMGDGQHGWAAAEWVMFIRNLFVREEEETLVLGSGILPRWLGDKSGFGPTATPYGPVSLDLVKVREGRVGLKLDARWHDAAPRLDVRVPGYAPQKNIRANQRIELIPSD